MKKIFNQLKEWCTTKQSLYSAMVAIILYTIADCLFGVLNAKYGTVFYFDPVLTQCWFEFWKWVVVTGGTISTVKILKTKQTSNEPLG